MDLVKVPHDEDHEDKLHDKKTVSIYHVRVREIIVENDMNLVLLLPAEEQVSRRGR